MWEYEHAVETGVAPPVLWRYWSDIAGWPAWNEGIEKIEVDGPLEPGTTFRMTPPGEEPIAMRIAEVEPGVSFVDEMDAGEFVVRTVHRLEPLPGGGTRIVYRTEFVGPAADRIGPELGPQITADFPDVLAALVRVAQG
ncbi:SRPBCC family protein [Amycolatopsis sp. NPDC026612]|uniref:SRPBCC family protein n=1 Tax=Amycolatopsis sp. NPDC026612 TaxID=3155466 RepID=UPI00340E6B3A